MVEKQRTLAKDVTLSGKGLHSGVDVEITLSLHRQITGINSAGLIFRANPL